MDRERLKEVHQTDLTESRVNEDFLDWLKNKGPSWLLAILIALCAFVIWQRVKEHRSSKITEAWVAYYNADLPASLEEVADQYAEYGSLANHARLRAAGQWLRAVQSGRKLEAEVLPEGTPDPADNALPSEERERYLANAERLFDAVIATDDQADPLALQVISALNGRAATAECRGDAETAAQWYAKAALRAGTLFPGLAAQATARAESAAANITAVTFPPKDPNRGRVAQPVKGGGGRIEPGLVSLLEPTEPGESGESVE